MTGWNASEITLPSSCRSGTRIFLQVSPNSKWAPDKSWTRIELHACVLHLRNGDLRIVRDVENRPPHFGVPTVVAANPARCQGQVNVNCHHRVRRPRLRGAADIRIRWH